jgi:ABC-type microcin C transport system duplicated ATPase subunit YejF
VVDFAGVLGAAAAALEAVRVVVGDAAAGEVVAVVGDPGAAAVVGAEAVRRAIRSGSRSPSSVGW